MLPVQRCVGHLHFLPKIVLLIAPAMFNASNRHRACMARRSSSAYIL